MTQLPWDAAREVEDLARAVSGATAADRVPESLREDVMEALDDVRSTLSSVAVWLDCEPAEAGS